MPEKISIVKESGETISSNIVSVFTIPDTEKKYIITTENSVDPHGLTVLHVSEIADGSLKKIATDDEWSSIKTIMRAIISGNVGSYKYLPAIEVIKAEGQYSRDISVSTSASKQMIDNYNAADKSSSSESDASIFPEAESAAAPADDNEVMPGITESGDEPPVESTTPETVAAVSEVSTSVETVPAEPAPIETTPAESVPTEAAQVEGVPTEVAPVDAVSTEPVPMDNTTLNVATTDVAPVEAIPAEPVPVEAPAEQTVSVQPTVAQPQVVPTVSAVSETQPVTSLETAPAVPVAVPAPVDAIAAQPEVVSAPVIVTTPQNETAAPVDNATVISVAPEVTPIPQPDVVTSTTIAQPVVPVEPAVQVMQPAQAVPTAQIAQGVPDNIVPTVQFDNNVTGSFKPDATLDEVVKGAEDMFMEGVRNLVQSIEEKVYRDLYIKEAELKKREALVAQKEQMLNTQFASMMSSITANFNGVGLNPLDTNNQNNPQ